ncbi:hypothetical protein J6590_022912 [Homalodisca vitripennis]|nr:hypothetical protein J6590_022912 [Homalodisca vitripennis]
MPMPAEATAFLGAVAAFLVLLLVFFLYFNKKWCFYAVACCDDPPPISSSAKELGKAYRCEEQETSSDSEEDVLRRLQTSQSLQSTRLLADSLPGPSARLRSCSSQLARQVDFEGLRWKEHEGGQDFFLYIQILYLQTVDTICECSTHLEDQIGTST